jgi:quercetin dioxygenase-like cupin family protein
MKLTLFVLTLIQANLVFAQDQSASEKVANDPAKRTDLFKQTLPNLDYRKVEVITVEYAPGASSPKHRHDVAVFAYVLEGSVQSQLEGEELKTFKQGEMWWEPPGTAHVVSRNASKKERAKLLVFSVGEQSKAPTTPMR